MYELHKGNMSGEIDNILDIEPDQTVGIEVSLHEFIDKMSSQTDRLNSMVEVLGGDNDY